MWGLANWFCLKIKCERINTFILLSDFQTVKTVPVSIDVVGLYNNIPNKEGLEEFRKALDKREDKSTSTDFLVELLELVLTLNILPKLAFKMPKNVL